MARSKAARKTVKSRRVVKLTVLKKIIWKPNDNMCLLYAIWEMMTIQQQLLITVSEAHCTLYEFEITVVFIYVCSLMESEILYWRLRSR